MLAMLYAIAAYAMFVGSFLYAVLFIGNLGIAGGLDGAARSAPLEALLADVALLALFAVQHSMWAAPEMSLGHLLFALGGTGYILVGIWFEERDLIAHFGDRYRAYRDQVGMLFPRPARRTGSAPAAKEG